VTCELQLAEWAPLDLPDCSADYALLPHGTARYELAFHAQARPDDFWVGAEINLNLWDEETGMTYLRRLCDLLEQVAADPSRPLSAYRV
jgi:hypothetical protein